jgi:HEAT repeat protein
MTVLRSFQALLLALLSLTLFAVVAPPDAAAQTRVEAPDALPSNWKPYVGEQLARGLQQPSAEQRAATMKTLITLSYRYGDALDLSACAEPLLKLTRTETTDGQRKLAITALYRTGDKEALRALVRQIRTESSPSVKRHAQRLLATHFAPEN